MISKKNIVDDDKINDRKAAVQNNTQQELQNIWKLQKHMARA